MIASTGRRTISAVSAGSWSSWPSAQRNSIATLRPSTKPTWFRPWRNPETRLARAAAVVLSALAGQLSINITAGVVIVLTFAGVGLLIARRGETYDMRAQERNRDLWIAGIATVYTAFIIYAGGMKFLLLSAILYAPGTALYFWARREQNKRVFTAVEWVIFAVAVIGAVIGIHGLATGYITI